MVAPDKSCYDAREGYCRKLGHHLKFAYCRTMKDGAPCEKILDCWFEKFDVRGFLETHYTEDEIAEIRKPQMPKTASLLELIEQARRRIE